VHRDRRAFIAAIAGVIGIPILFAALGGSQAAGLAVGVVLVVIGIVAAVRGR
jgi:hypothetical protein